MTASKDSGPARGLLTRPDWFPPRVEAVVRGRWAAEELVSGRGGRVASDGELTDGALGAGENDGPAPGVDIGNVGELDTGAMACLFEGCSSELFVTGAGRFKLGVTVEKEGVEAFEMTGLA